jgi:hypothetical protein
MIRCADVILRIMSSWAKISHLLRCQPGTQLVDIFFFARRGSQKKLFTQFGRGGVRIKVNVVPISGFERGAIVWPGRS